ncbi:type VI secretion system baseplate subunit TssK [Parasulfitobacter algicola]|uniref:Type VI secretion system baseplate subunit TssK n=1 Tax=Parasulfitobacter algicola TaxID=2614809 RepID=A0ABX2ILI3_9RHOB|nr:type VI secretion system baseplate subunit TssK [Sulfitobacter algicola]
MKTANRVAWTEGMFLRTQHFQQADRWAEHLVVESTRPLAPYPWGITEISIDQSALAIGRFGLTSISGILADGTPFSAPEHCDLPAPLILEEGVKNATVFLTLPMLRPGAPSFAPEDGPVSARQLRSDYDAADANTDSAFSAEIGVARLRFALKLDSDDMSGLERLMLGRVIEVRTDLSVVLDETIIPPALNIGASRRLSGLLTEFLGLIRHRAEAIARRAGDPSLRGAAEVGDYLMLQALNRASPVIAHLNAQASQIHPEILYRHCVSLAGELATLTEPTRLPEEFPAYRHDDIEDTFAPVFAALRRALSSVLEQSAVPIPLEQRRHGVRVGMINDASLLKEAGFVLAVRADMPNESLRRTLPNQIKVGPVERIAELVNVALPGVAVRPAAVAPRQLPFSAGTVYFDLDTDSDIWDSVKKSGTLAIHLATEFPGIELELWGLR